MVSKLHNRGGRKVNEICHLSVIDKYKSRNKSLSLHVESKGFAIDRIVIVQ
jgi:hypothetical protein